MKLQVSFAILLSIATANEIAAQEKGRRGGKAEYPPQMNADSVEVYKTVGDVKLQLYVFQPSGHQASAKRPAIVFFFGGGWTGGSPKQFEQQCRYLASRGMVGMAADYRVASRHGVKGVSCVADAKSAIRWVRANAGKLGVDSQKIVAAGGSAGGHVAACTGVIEGFDEPSVDLKTSSRPNAMILFNPAVVLAAVDGVPPLRNADRISERMGVEAKTLSPYHHVKSGAPPTLILHGKDDNTVPYKTVEQFTEAMTKAGNRCELEGYEGAAHGFFNFGKSGNKHFVATLTRADKFLASLGYINGEPTVQTFFANETSTP